MEEGGHHFHESKFIDQQGNLRTARVPVVQELARRGLDHLPERFVRLQPNPHLPSDDKPCTGSGTESPCFSDSKVPIPCIDLAKLREGLDLELRAGELAKLAGEAKELGTFIIEGHGIGNDVLDGVRDVVRGFFGLSFEEKKGCVGSYMSVDNMGYGRNFIKSDDQPLDWIDRLTMKAFPKGATDGLDVWPRRPPNFRQVMEAYAGQSRTVLNEVAKALAKAFSLEEHVFLEYLDREDGELNVRINYYPPCPRPDQALGIIQHSDASALTLLMQFGASDGLQIFKNGEWRTADWPEDALLVGVGDLMEIMSDGRVKSLWHRVVTRLSSERFSIAMFYNPPTSAEIDPIKGGCNEYKKVVAGDYCRHVYEISPTKEKDAIKFAKIV